MGKGNQDAMKSEDRKDYWNLAWIAVACAAVFIGIVILTNYFFASPNELGDSAGIANGLFSALAFAGVVFAIILQRNELKLQREELEHTREELKGQKEEFKTQNATLKIQRFENTLFNLLSLLHQIVSQLRVSYETTVVKVDEDLYDPYDLYDEGIEKKDITVAVEGRNSFLYLFLYAPTTYDHIVYKGLKQILEKFDIDGYSKSDMPSLLDHYFRTLYRIVKFIDTTQLLGDFEERWEYMGIVRAQLSEYELIWLFYNCLSPSGSEKFKPLIEKYALFQNLRAELLVKPEHKDKYNECAINALFYLKHKNIKL